MRGGACITIATSVLGFAKPRFSGVGEPVVIGKLNAAHAHPPDWPNQQPTAMRIQKPGITEEQCGPAR